MIPEVVSEFRKSSYSDQEGDCVEVAHTAVAGRAGRAVRDSKNVGGPVQFHSAEQWAGFLTAMKAGELLSR